MSVNVVCISGNLTRDAELRATASGMQVLNMSVAVNERVKSADGQWTDRANYVDAVLFGTRAEKLAQYLSKGSKVAIEGKLRWSQWEKDGQKRSKLEVVVDEIEFMSRRQDGGGYQQPYQPAPMPRPQAAPAPDLYPSEIPF